MTNTQWAYASYEDIQIAEKVHILHCKVEGKWNLNDPQHIKYTSRNSDQIIAIFSKHQNSSRGYKGYVSTANVENIQVFYNVYFKTKSLCN